MHQNSSDDRPGATATATGPLVLLVEDERSIAEPFAQALRRAGFRTTVAQTAAEAISQAAARGPDVVLLDLALPDGDGRDVCRRIRRESSVPIIMVTASGSVTDRVVGLELGADDYVVKPFSVRELILRIRALMRRVQRTEGEPSLIRFGRLKIDRDAHRAWVDDSEIGLTALEFRLLHAFLSRRGRVQTRDALLSDVWGIDADVTTRTVDTHVKRLREKLGDAGAYIETLRGVGYRFKGEPEEAEA
jgi:two-component system, OmpR family, phosphate regulon response regulator PhoB